MFTKPRTHIHVWTWDRLGVIEQCRECGEIKPDEEEA